MPLLREVLENGTGKELDKLGVLLGMHRKYHVDGKEISDDDSYRKRLLQHPTVILLLTYCDM
jgi:hypothetical protein